MCMKCKSNSDTLPPREFEAFIVNTLGSESKIIECRHFLQEGYTEALTEKIRMMDENGNEVPLPV